MILGMQNEYLIKEDRMTESARMNEWITILANYTE